MAFLDVLEGKSEFEVVNALGDLIEVSFDETLLCTLTLQYLMYLKLCFKVHLFVHLIKLLKAHVCIRK